MKRNSLFLSYVLSMLFAVLLFTPSNVSTNMLAIFESDENIEKLKVMNSFEKASTLFVSIEGFSNENRTKLLKIEKELQAFPFVKETRFNTSKIKISDYVKDNYYLLSDFKGIALDKETIQERTEKLKVSILDAMFYTPIDKNDPFKLFTFDTPTQSNMTKNGFLTLGKRGYLLTAEIDAKLSEMKNAQAIEHKLAQYFQEKEEVLAFSTLFFTAQNSKIIKSNVHTILYISFALLIVLFFITLRDYRLLFANSITLASSIFFALALSTYIFDEVSIFTLAFGSAISSMSVDYLFHNYFHGQYRKKGINYSIMFAFLTTVLGFFILQFVRFPLIEQLAVFAILSLSFSYFQFTFLYPYLGLAPKEKRINIVSIMKGKGFLSSRFVVVLSTSMMLYAAFNLNFDYNFQNLDYNNKALKADQKIIEDAFPSKHTILVEADNLDELIRKTKALQTKIPASNSLARLSLTEQEVREKSELIDSYDFELLHSLLNERAKELGFKEDYFVNAYQFTRTMEKNYAPKLENFKELGYEVIQKNNKLYTIVTIDNRDVGLFKSGAGLTLIESSSLVKESLITMFESLLFYLFISFMLIVLFIFFIVKEQVVFALNFILFPMAIIMFYLSFIQVNIMHLFSMIVIVVAGIDYGIYMSKENSAETNEAILYSLLTTFSGFGILIFSSIGAIHAIGEVISLGIISIIFLILSIKIK